MTCPDRPHITLDFHAAVPWPEPGRDVPGTLARVIAATLRQAGLAGWYAVSLSLTSDRQIQRINHEHRGIDAPTDVLAFPLSDAPLRELPAALAWTDHPYGDDTHAAPLPPAGRSAMPLSDVTMNEASCHHYGAPERPWQLGDIILAVPAVQREAKANGHAPWWELCFLVAHAALHLVGFDDYFEPGHHAMVARQEAALASLGLTDDKR